MIGVIQVFFLVLVILAVVWCLVLLVSINRMDKGQCACGHFRLGHKESFAQYSYDDAPVFIHERNRCYPFLEEIV